MTHRAFSAVDSLIGKYDAGSKIGEAVAEEDTHEESMTVGGADRGTVLEVVILVAVIGCRLQTK